jgi:hypothetical protein
MAQTSGQPYGHRREARPKHIKRTRLHGKVGKLNPLEMELLRCRASVPGHGVNAFDEPVRRSERENDRRGPARQPPPDVVIRSIYRGDPINFHYRPTPPRHDTGEAAHPAPSIPAFPNTL